MILRKGPKGLQCYRADFEYLHNELIRSNWPTKHNGAISVEWLYSLLWDPTICSPQMHYTLSVCASVTYGLVTRVHIQQNCSPKHTCNFETNIYMSSQHVQVQTKEFCYTHKYFCLQI